MMEWGLNCAAIAVVYAVIIAGEDTPLRPWFLALERWHDAGGWRSWLASPMGGCAKCTAGQLALWSYSLVEPWTWGMSAMNHVFAACWAVLFAIPISMGVRWIQRQL